MDPNPGSGILNLFDPGFGIEKFGSRIRVKHPESAKCLVVSRFDSDLALLATFFFILSCFLYYSFKKLFPFSCRSASGAALLVRSLPRLRRLAYQNMRRVVALLLQPGAQAEQGKAGQYGQAGLNGQTELNGLAGQYGQVGRNGLAGQNGEAGQYDQAAQYGEAGLNRQVGQNGEAGQYGKVFEYGLDFLDSMEHTGEYDLEVEDGSYWASGRGLPKSSYLSLHWVCHCCGSGSGSVSFWKPGSAPGSASVSNIKQEPDPHQSDKLHPDLHQCVEDKPKCLEYEPI